MVNCNLSWNELKMWRIRSENVKRLFQTSTACAFEYYKVVKLLIIWFCFFGITAVYLYTLCLYHRNGRVRRFFVVFDTWLRSAFWSTDQWRAVSWTFSMRLSSFPLQKIQFNSIYIIISFYCCLQKFLTLYDKDSTLSHRTFYWLCFFILLYDFCRSTLRMIRRGLKRLHFYLLWTLI